MVELELDSPVNRHGTLNCLDAFITEVLGTRVVSDGYL